VGARKQTAPVSHNRKDVGKPILFIIIKQSRAVSRCYFEREHHE
jgi:hypothetical protein